MKHTTLAGMLEDFRNDPENRPYEDGRRRFDRNLEWLEATVRRYAEKIGVTPDECTALLEAGRDCWWPNYYQEANFPYFDDKHFVGYFASPDASSAFAREHWRGFRCPKCGNVGKSPTECDHRIKGDGVCDWCAFGLFQSPFVILVRDNGRIVVGHIFEPVPKDPATDARPPKAT